ncbi:vascular endothelial growth factor receptor 2 [Octopus bimaculoides]|uniref:vascular endothelial growth factor receptor 2 n=1 Tax=Octopus bimaculoides TaxID=37653 RepID=UPI0022E41C71|nr:vascular endothelial growth factor receptor 2 [Octopus bimaculoides]
MIHNTQVRMEARGSVSPLTITTMYFGILLTLLSTSQLPQVLAFLVIDGPKDHGVSVKSNTTFFCKVYDTNFSGPGDWEPFLISWSFQPLNGAPTTILEVEIHRMEFIQQLNINENKYSTSNGYELHVKSVTFADAGNYTCMLNISDEKVGASLFVLEKPHCSIPPMPLMVNVLTHFNCSVNYAGLNAPHLEWYHGPDIMDTDSNITSSTVSSTLTISATRDKNGHIFTCYAKYEEQTFTTYCQTIPPLSIYFPVRVETTYAEPRKRYNIYSRGDDVYLHCIAFGNPIPDYHWVYTSPDSRNHFVLSQLNYYRIRNVQRGDEGNYSCRVTNKYNGQTYEDEKIIQIRITDDQKPFLQHTAKKSFHYSFPVNTISPYTIGAVISSSLAVILIIVFIVLAVRLRGEYSDNRHGWEIPRRFIKLHELIGKGVYTEVWRGKMQKNPAREDMVRVAIKRLMVEATDKEKKFFLEEMEVLKMLPPHHNIIHLIGCYTLHEPQLIVLEYAAEGTLRNYLQRHRLGQQEIEINSGHQQAVRLRNYALTPQMMLNLATQILRGMEHLLRFKLISYRLTSASVLVAKGGVIRLTGFGFQEDVMSRNLYEATSLPVRWMCPESIKERIFNITTDVWAFGILLWEIIHFGLTPYPTMGPQEVCEKVTSGYRMPQPPQCSAELYGLMLSCWQSHPANRPSLEELHHLLKSMSRVYSEHILFEKIPEYQRASPYDQLDSDL